MLFRSLSIPATISTSEPAVSFDFPITPAISISEPTVIFDSIACHVFASAPALLLTYSPLAACLPITTPLPKTPNVAFEISALTYVPQMALSATIDSDVACHALGMVFDPGINFSMDSAPSDFHPHPDVSFSHFISQFALILLFAISVFFVDATLMQHPVALHFSRCFFSRHIFVAALCLAVHTSAFSNRNVTEDSHYFS